VILRAAEQPYDGAALIDFLRRRMIPGVEEYADGVYRRSLPSGEIVELRPHPEGMEATHDVSALLDLDAPAAEIAARVDLPGYDPGTRVPGCVSGEEIAVRAVLGQQISIQAAATHAGRLVEVAGVPLEHPVGSVTHRFPTLEAIAGAPDSAFAMPKTRRDTLRSLAGQPLDRLIDLRGIGPWTQTYVNMRALRDRDAWLPTDLGVRHALHDGGVDAERWRPFRAYAVVHLWRSLS
jgi:AraC family transcriptional regulator, regulatory protein of adaptative response / DNA-3-methyladenine glycosylase II